MEDRISSQQGGHICTPQEILYKHVQFNYPSVTLTRNLFRVFGDRAFMSCAPDAGGPGLAPDAGGTAGWVTGEPGMVRRRTWLLRN